MVYMPRKVRSRLVGKMLPCRVMWSPILQLWLPGKVNVDDAARAVALPGGELVGGHDFVGGDVEVFVGVGSELCEEVFRLVVLILATKPGHGDDVHDAGNGADLVPIIDGMKLASETL